MANSATLRGLVGPFMPITQSFAAAEAGVAAGTALVYVGESADAGDGTPPMPYDGYVVGVLWSTEASANFTLQVTKDGTADTGQTVAVTGATGGSDMFEPGGEIAFSAGEVLGLKTITDTVSKDVNATLLILLETP